MWPVPAFCASEVQTLSITNGSAKLGGLSTVQEAGCGRLQRSPTSCLPSTTSPCRGQVVGHVGKRALYLKIVIHVPPSDSYPPLAAASGFSQEESPGGSILRSSIRNSPGPSRLSNIAQARRASSGWLPFRLLGYARATTSAASRGSYGSSPLLAQPSPTEWRVSSPGFVPQEREADKRSVGRRALGTPLVKAPWQLDTTLNFRGDVKYHADRHVEVDTSEVFIDA